MVIHVMYFKQILEILMLFIWMMFGFEFIRQSSASHKCDILATFCIAIQISRGFVDLPQYFSILNAIITIFGMFFQVKGFLSDPHLFS